MCSTTRAAFEKTSVRPEQVTGISFCSQMQGMVLVDEHANALRRPMSYMDQRAGAEFRACQTHGLTISGVNAGMMLRSLAATHAASTSVKDPLWKYKWVQAHEPVVFQKAHKWLDVKEYLIACCTGEFVMTRDSAYSTFLYDTRPGHEGWNDSLCKMYGVEPRHLPRIIECRDVAGTLTGKGRGGAWPLRRDARLWRRRRRDAHRRRCGRDRGRPDAHLLRTSGWVGTVMDHQAVDVAAMMAGIVGAEPGKYNYFAEMETAGKCFEWVKDHLVLDEVNVYLAKTDVAESRETVYESLYDYMSDTVAKVAPGSGGVVFTPWLHGNRCPFEDAAAAGMFFNLRLETGKAQMLRAVLEGICFHLRWMLEVQEKKTKTSDPIRFVGGGALSPVTCQMLADITGRTIETVENTKDVGSHRRGDARRSGQRRVHEPFGRGEARRRQWHIPARSVDQGGL